jgi:hypothetical protein
MTSTSGRYSVIVALLLSCVPAVGYAQSVFKVLGVGNNSCGQYLSAVHNHPPGKYRVMNHQEGQFSDQHARYYDWLAGFVSASNLWMARTNTGSTITTDNAAIDVWVRRWCEQNPTKTVTEAANEFVISHSR